MVTIMGLCRVQTETLDEPPQEVPASNTPQLCIGCVTQTDSTQGNRKEVHALREVHGLTTMFCHLDSWTEGFLIL